MKKINVIFLSLWLIGCCHILYMEQQYYVLFPCSLFSLYFLGYFILEILDINKKYPYLSYFIISCILAFQAFIAFSIILHAPPDIIAFIKNTFLLLIFHFIIYPMILIFNKKTPQ